MWAMAYSVNWLNKTFFKQTNKHTKAKRHCIIQYSPGNNVTYLDNNDNDQTKIDNNDLVYIVTSHGLM